MNLETKITIYKFTPQLFTLTHKNTQSYILGCKKGCKSRKCLIYTLYCGERGIRTPGTVARTPHFECGPIDHSGISPGPSPTLRPVIRSANIAIFRKKSIFGTKKDSNFYFHPPNVFPDFIAIFVRY